MVEQTQALATASSKQLFAGGVAAALAASLWFVTPEPYSPLLLPLAVLAIIAAVGSAFYICLVFIVLSYFRLQEAFPVLLPLRLPLVLAGLVILGVFSRWFSRSEFIVPRTLEMKLLFAFFVLVTTGMFFAVNIEVSMVNWSESYWKIVITCVLLAALMREVTHFRYFGRIFIIAGLAVAVVAITNHSQGIGLVEGSRVTIGRDLGSYLGDPNQLALILMVPLGYSTAYLARGSGIGDTALGAAGGSLCLYAIALTQSRGGFLGVIAMIFVLNCALSRRKSLGVFLALLLSLVAYLAMEVSDRVGGSVYDFGEDEAATTRLYAWQAAVRMAFAYPIWGVGIGGSEGVFYAFTPVWTYTPLTAHSAWFQALGETGWIGGAMFVALVLVSFKAALRAWRSSSRAGTPLELQASALGLLTSLSGLCVAGSFLSCTFQWPFYVVIASVSALNYALERLPN